MGIASSIAGAVSGVVKPVAGVFNKRTERKMAKEAITGKLAMQKQGDGTAITLTDAEWETVGQSMSDKSWKDEYVTVSLVSILNMLILGGVLSAFDHPEVLTGTVAGIAALSNAGVDLGYLLTAVVFAAIGLKLWRA